MSKQSTEFVMVWEEEVFMHKFIHVEKQSLGYLSYPWLSNVILAQSGRYSSNTDRQRRNEYNECLLGRFLKIHATSDAHLLLVLDSHRIADHL